MSKSDKELTVELVTSYIAASGEDKNVKIMSNNQYDEFIQTIYQTVRNLNEQDHK